MLQEEQERLLQEEQERLLQEEQERLLQEEQERLLQEEQERLLQEEQERLLQEEIDRKNIKKRLKNIFIKKDLVGEWDFIRQYWLVRLIYQTIKFPYIILRIIVKLIK